MGIIFSKNRPGTVPPLWCQNHADLKLLIEGLPVSQKAKNQFRRALAKPSTAFLERLILPFMWDVKATNPADHTYICLSPIKELPGRNHYATEIMARHPSFDWRTDINTVMLFTNRLIVDYTQAWVPPSERVVGGGPIVFTIEYDEHDLGFFEEQMAWCRSSGSRPEDAQLGAVFRHFSQFHDFLGLTVNWSGNKSLHIHLAFDSAPICAMTGLDNRAMRPGLQAHWDEVAVAVSTLLGVPETIKPDAMLRQPEGFRRLPWGGRVIDKANLLGIPRGTIVPQIVLWERWRGRAADGATSLFFRPDPFAAPPEVKKQRAVVGTGGNQTSGVLSESERAYCQQCLDEIVKRQVAAVGAVGPILYRLEFLNGRWIARFRNSQCDSNPSSILREDHNRVLLCGRDNATAARVQLPYTLGTMMQLWVARFRRPTPAVTVETAEYDVLRNRPLTKLELAFQEEVVDKDSALRMMRKAVGHILDQHDRAVVKGPEGAGKSRALFSVFHQLMRRYAGVRLPGGGRGPVHAMFAFATYDMAEKKSKEFNVLQEKQGYCAVVLRSFEREYKEACVEVGVAPYQVEDAFAVGRDHLVDLIREQQTEVWDEMKRRHAALWKEVGTAKPVFFTVHGVAEQWAAWGVTRLWWHREYHKKFARMTPQEMKWDMRLYLLVYDEVGVDTFITRHREEAVAWVDLLVREQPSWRSSTAKTRDRWRAFSDFSKNAGWPRFNGQDIALSFHDAQAIAAVPKRRRDMVETRCSGEYAEDEPRDTDIYQAVAGRSWCVLRRDWWSNVATKVLILTTEALPTLVAAQVGWSIYELDCPKIAPNHICVHFDRSVVATNVGKVITAFRNKQGKRITVISNKAKTQVGTHTHHKAKGDNAFVGHDMAQTLMYVNPDEYEALEVINAWAGTDRAVRLRHVDELNQTAGRNLGFRWDGKAEHHLLISKGLFLKLRDVLFDVSRYGFRIEVDANKIYEIKRRTY